MPIAEKHGTITVLLVIRYQKIQPLLVIGLHQIAVVVLQQGYADHLQVKVMHLELLMIHIKDQKMQDLLANAKN